MPDSQAPQDEPALLGRRARKALATRQALFERGLAAFENRPLGMVSVLDLTEAADVAKGVFYLHFRGKDEYLISLWEHVQRTFLEALAPRLEPCRSRGARLEATVTHYHAMIAGSPRECRFWLRMSTYFDEEIGEPGQMSGLRREYLRNLAALIAGVSPERVGEPELRVASVADGASWGLISQAVQLGSSALDEERFVKVVTRAIGAAG